MKVICISAKAQHGKDTAANILKEYLESINKKVLIIHNADLLKFICSTYFGWDGVKDDKGRSILQYIGTDVIRSKRPDFWVDFIADFLKLFSNTWDFVFIPDCRFPNEVTRLLRDFNTAVLRIERPGFDNGLSIEQQSHPSETSMDNFAFDAVISNDGTLEEFKQKLIAYINTKI